MAGFFRKKRRGGGPSKNEQKVMRSRELERRAKSAGVLSSRYPSVKHLIVRLEFLSPQRHVLSQQTREFGPGDVLNFTASCPGQCGVGSFNLEGKIELVVVARLALSEASGTCQEPLYAGSKEVCGCELKCRIEAEYEPEPAPEPERSEEPLPPAGSAGPAG